MKTENTWDAASISPAAIEAIVRQARIERAQVMRAELVALPAKVKRLIANFRPVRQRKPQTSAYA